MQTLSPLVWERLWMLPVPPASTVMMSYLLGVSEYGGHIPVKQDDMAKTLRTTPQAISKRLKPLCEINLLLRPDGEKRAGNRYRLHPWAAKYENPDKMADAIRQATADIQAGRLATPLIPAYIHAPLAKPGRPDLRVVRDVS
ncbi:hypothetical protein ACFC1B_07430 [Streptomyces xiamenensis]|uniref:hypothetical protein n=1 Tax=Streptomyces xiamenensis TaxID=408015 RepID=UPI0035E074D6